MSSIDLRDQIVYAAGKWLNPGDQPDDGAPFAFTVNETKRAERLLLRWKDDAVTLAGPLRIRVSFQTENLTYELGAWSARSARQVPVELIDETGGAAGTDLGETSNSVSPGSGLPINTNAALLGVATLQASTVYGYDLDIPAGQVWPFVFNATDHAHKLGANYFDRVLIEPAGFNSVATPIVKNDLPCNFAKSDLPDSATFFPAACEPCEPGSQLHMPELAPALTVRNADGGCVRTRFFNGMAITREDLETEQRYLRVKNRLHNRTLGQGVVWGLNVGKQGDHVCVLPGYAIDCCGNDLTVTSVYQVEIAALLRDPAVSAYCAKAMHGARKLHLLLEYVECPSAPRSVHTDPCGPSQQLCEPSRIRETVRLRLVPPRELDPSGPLQDFLMTVQSLHEKYGQKVETTTDMPGISAISLSLNVEGQVHEVKADSHAAVKFNGNNVEFSARVDGGVFTGGMLQIIAGEGNAKTLIEEKPLALLSLPGASGVEVELDPETKVYEVVLRKWRAESPLAPEAAWAYVGDAPYTLSKDGSGWRIKPSKWSQEATDLLRKPVCGDPCRAPENVRPAQGPCDPPATQASAVPWPWLHSDPLDENRAGDPKAVILGILGAWLQHSVASSTEKGVSEPWSVQRLAATYIYRSAWLLFYGVADSEKPDVGDALQRLLRGWCSSALYQGPGCAGEPHGVVIGCTTLQAGTLGEIDPFGGRRYVVQYPLLTHWASQFGLAPLDTMITRLSSLLCCVATLPRPTTMPDTPAFIHKIAEVKRDAAATIEETDRSFGDSAYIAFGTPAAIEQAYKDETGRGSFDFGQPQELSFSLFAAYVIDALRGRFPAAGAQADGEDNSANDWYTLGGVFEPGVASLLIQRR